MLQIQAIPTLTDNYCWAISHQHSLTLIDPGEAQPVLDWVSQQALPLVSIMITHHHPDHWGGVDSLQRKHPQCRVYITQGHLYPPTLTGAQILSADSDFIDPQSQLHWRIHAVPGHTLDHLAFQVGEHLFCGDVLFSAGCGRLFEGDATTLLASLKKLTTLPAHTHIYPGHEYTQDNLEFALSIEPNNPQIHQALADCRHKRQQQTPSLPTTLAHELSINPFLRCHLPPIQQQVSQITGHSCDEEVSAFEQLRQLRNQWKRS